MITTHAANNVFGKSYGGNAPEVYERYFVPVIGQQLATNLVRDAGIREGQKILDVACGTGVVARTARARVGKTGSVSAADINPAMLHHARSVSTDTEPAITWFETSAEAMPFPDASFDVVLCQLGLQFIVDKDAALAEMRRVLVPEGRAWVSVPQPTAFFEVMHEGIARHVGPDAAAFVRLVFSLNDPRELEQMLGRAGFDDLQVRTVSKEFHLPAAEAFLWQYIQCTPLGATIMAMDESRRQALHRDVVEGWRPWSTDRGMTSQQSLLVGSGRKPAA